eukprot:1297476-Ditylum_brightwellii.AAC.1
MGLSRSVRVFEIGNMDWKGTARTDQCGIILEGRKLECLVGQSGVCVGLVLLFSWGCIWCSDRESLASWELVSCSGGSFLSDGVATQL